MSHEGVLVAIIDANKLGSMGPLAAVREIVLNGRIFRYTPLDVMLPVYFDIHHSITPLLFLEHCTFCCLGSCNLLRMQTAFFNCFELR